MRILIYLISCICLISCENDKKSNRKSILMPYAESEFIYVVIPMVYEKDSFLCCCDNESIYDILNIKIISNAEFKKLLYEKNINNEYLELSKEGYDEFKPFEIKVIPEMNNVYKEKGINGVLSTYDVDYLGWNSQDEYRYFVYLCWINNLSVIKEDESNKFVVH